MIVLRNVVKIYDTGKQALAGVTLAVPRNDFVFLVGANGAGKSTLLKLLIRAEFAASGVIIVAGHDLRLLPDHRVPAFRQQIGIVFQEIRLFPEKTVYENVALSLQVSGGPRRGKMKTLVMEALDLVGLADHAHRFPSQISGGEQQRAAIARAIVRSPQLLIADEPTGNLPPDVSWQIMQLLGEINRRGVTTVVATHDRAIVDGMKRRVVELLEGRVVRDQRYGLFAPAASDGPPFSAWRAGDQPAIAGLASPYPGPPPGDSGMSPAALGQLGSDSGLYPAMPPPAGRRPA